MKNFAAVNSFPKPIRGEPIHPTLYDDWNCEYYDPRFLTKKIVEVRVGGIPWNETKSKPKPGEWIFNEEMKLLELGSVTLGGRVVAYVE